jgi:hypothetical protein
MSALATESRLLVAFGRAAVKAQEIEVLLQETVIILEVTADTQNRSLEAISKRIEKLPLGPLKDKYLKSIGAGLDPNFSKMWNEINQERIFLMHKFFQVFSLSADLEKAAERLEYIDKLLDIGHRLLKDVRYLTLKQMNLTPAKVRELLALAVELRKKRTTSE